MGFSIYRFITGATDRAIRLRGFRREFVDALGSLQHYYVSPGKGDLPPVVVIHGLSGEATDLAPMFGTLRKHFSKVMVPDLPGHGRSQVPREGMKSASTFETFAAGLDQMIKEPAIILGNSLGGLATIRYANRSPHKVKGIVLYSPGGAQMSLRELIVFKHKFRNSNREETARFLDMLVTKAPWYRRIVENVLRNRFLQPPVRELIGNVTPDILLQPEEVQSLQPPTLFVWGKADTLQSNQVHFFKEHLPAHAEILEPDHFAHCPFLDQHKDCTRMAIEFAHTIRSRTHSRQAEMVNLGELATSRE
jgi:pimeloyl-ACP methyl ester carboxylesterase